jgi:acetyl esterase/lipase
MRPPIRDLCRFACLAATLAWAGPPALGAAAPPRVPPFTIDTVMAALRSTYPNATRVPDTLPPGVVAHEEIVYARQGDIALGLDIYRPADSRTLPAVLVVHGGGWVAGDRRMERPFARALALRGYVAVPVSYRLGRAGRFPASILDLRAAVRWLRAHAVQFGVDPACIGAVGGSAGGTLVTFLGAANGETLGGDPGDPACEVEAVVDIDGTATFLDERLIRKSEGGPSPYYELTHGPYRAAPEVWAQASPIRHVTRRSAPTLFLMSSVRQPILAGREEMAGKLKALGIRTGMVRFPDTPHTFWLVRPWFDRVVAETDLFLAGVLKPRR